MQLYRIRAKHSLENDAQVDLLFNRNGFSPLMSAKLDMLKWLMYYWAVALLNINLQDKMGGVLYCLPVDRDIRK